MYKKVTHLYILLVFFIDSLPDIILETPSSCHQEVQQTDERRHRKRTMYFSISQAFARSSTMASSGVRENVHTNTKMELCGKMLFLIMCSKFYFILFLFYLFRCYGWLLSRFADISEPDGWQMKCHPHKLY